VTSATTAGDANENHNQHVAIKYWQALGSQDEGGLA
jgi:hypothetical protein